MAERDKGTTYTCPVCGQYGFAWDGRARVWMCHWRACSHTEKHRDPQEAQCQTMFEALLYLVNNTPPPLGSDTEHKDQQRLVKELGEIIKLGDK